MLVWKYIVQMEIKSTRATKIVVTLPDGPFSHGTSPGQRCQTRMLTRMFRWMMAIQQMSICIRMPSISIRHFYTNGTSSRIATFRGHIKQTVEEWLLLLGGISRFGFGIPIFVQWVCLFMIFWFVILIIFYSFYLYVFFSKLFMVA